MRKNSTEGIEKETRLNWQRDPLGDLQKIWNEVSKKLYQHEPEAVVLGATPKKLKKRLQDLGSDTKIVELQNSAIIHTARILRKVLQV